MRSMSMNRKSSAGTTFVKGIHVSKWQGLMKEFYEKTKDKCKAGPLDIRTTRVLKYFPTGSSYEGQWDLSGMKGYGEYIFASGVKYEGDFLDGMMHGKGTLQYRCDDGTSILRGVWRRGVMTERTLLFSDTLEYHEDFWKYCTGRDRRFAIEYDIDLMPAGKSFLTADQPTKEIPPGLYDTGDGFYNPKTKAIYKYNAPTTIIRSPSLREQKWILDNCRMSEDKPRGPRPDLYEKWLEPALKMAPQPPPAAGVKTTPVTTFRQSIQEQEIDYDKMPVFYDASKCAAETRPQRKLRLVMQE